MRDVLRRKALPAATALAGLAICVVLNILSRDSGPIWSLGKLLAAFSIMVLLLRERTPIGAALLIGSLSLGLSFGLSMGDLVKGFTLGVFNPADSPLHGLGGKAFRLALLVFLINFLGRLLILAGSIRTLIDSLERLFRDTRWVMAAISSIIGLLPMPGGALLSAPMVGELSDRMHIRPAQRTLVNYWFRHVWEWWWPLFPAILIVVTDGYLTVPQVLVYQGPFTLGAIGLGWFFILRPIARPTQTVARARPLREVGRVVGVLWPVLLVVAAVLVVRLPDPYDPWLLPCALVGAEAILLAVTRPRRLDTVEAVRHSAQWTLFVLVYGVYVLRAILTLSHAAEQLPSALDALHVPGMAACFLVPFTINLITGYNVAGVSMALPLLVALFAQTGPAGVAVAYSGAFLGVLASPVHLCLALTKEYFHAEWGAVYRLLLPLLLGMLVLTGLIGWIG